MATASQERRAAEAVALIWENNKDRISSQVDVLEDAVAALLEGSLSAELRDSARANAHKLAGSVGTFGFSEGSALAREMELIFQDSTSIDDARIFRLSELVVQLRTELSRDIAFVAESGLVEEEPALGEGPLVLICSQDRNLAERLSAEAVARGMRTLSSPDVYSTSDIVAAEHPDAVLLDFELGERTEIELRLLEELAAMDPPLPALVITSSEEFTNRVEVARRGGRGFLDRNVDPKAAMDAVAGLVRGAGRVGHKVLVVVGADGLPDGLVSLLEQRGLVVSKLDDARGFWEVLEDLSPDLVVMDDAMEHISGIELCRVVRNDPRWAGVPIVLLAERDPETMERAFAAGADDFVSKPITGPEVVLRVQNRLDRSQLHRDLIDTDQQTGIANRRKATQILDGHLRLARRFGQPMCLALLDVDGLKRINDEHGHNAGDRAMRKLADILQKTFRGEDVVARWTGDEFVLGMFGMLRDDGVQRTAAVLEAIRPLDFAGVDGKTFAITFSAGVAQFPDDGSDVHSLYRAADGAVRLAKTSGRNRVVPVGWDPDKGDLVERHDVVLVEDDRPIAELLLHALDTRGYRTHWIQDGAEAVALLGGATPHLRARVILLDVNLPGIDGLGVLRKLHQDDSLRGTRVIMLTVRSNEAEVVKALELGAFDHVAKPFSIPILMQRIRRALGKQ